tara:strand:- start:1469 stop:2566 length:1098 start_codon:yes stop_codon:yes gene_type:complete
MALDNYPSIPGKVNGTGARTANNAANFAANNALFLKVFSGEILTAFDESNVAKDLIMTRTISSGKSAQFPVTGKAEAKYHIPGNDLLGTGDYLSQIAHNEKVINIDDMLVASTLIPRIDEVKNHYDLRSIYGKELGKALAKRLDIQILKTMFAAGLTTTANVTGGDTGTQLLGANTMTALGLVEALFECARALDEKEVPSDGRYAILSPFQYYKLLTGDSTAINKDTSSGSADAAKGSILEVAGIKLYKSPHLVGVQVAVGSQNADDANVANSPFANTAINNDDAGYNADLAGVREIASGEENNVGFVAGHASAVGCVKLLDLATESEYLIERQSTLFVAKYAMGLGVLRPESSVVVNTTSSVAS